MTDSKINILILTATVTPPIGATRLARTDPKMRLNDYHQALKYYLSCLVDGKISGLIFADNSASDITELQDLCQKYDLTQKTEFISFEGLDYPPTYGRGYGEFKMIDYVMEHSRLIQELPPQANIWKVTGRYVIHNLEDIIKTRPSSSDLYCHFRNRPTGWMDLYILCWNKRAYHKILKNIHQFIREDITGCCAEQAFRKVLEQQDSDIEIVKRFRTLPELEGISGHDNRSYRDNSIKFWVRKIANVIVPWLWI